MGSLDGIRVLELGSLIAGPFCGRILADHGADVIKIEAPDAPDPMRAWGRHLIDGRSVTWAQHGRNKRAITLNLRQPEGRALALHLVEKADVVLENFRPGTMEKWGLGYDELARANPGIIMVRVSGFGQTGPYAARAGFGSVGEAMGGIRHVTGYPDRPPVRVGLSLGDALAGLYAAVGTLMALQARTNHPQHRGQMVDVALYEAVFSLMEGILSEYCKLGVVAQRTGNTLPGAAPSNVYPSSDGGWVVIGANADTVFRRLAAAMGEPELADDSRFSSHIERGAHAEELDDRIAAWTRQFAIDEVLHRLEDASVPAGKIYSAADIAADPHYQARDMLLAVDDPALGQLTQLGIIPKLSATPGEVRWTAPTPGQHNREVLADLSGMNEAQLSDLAAAGII